MTEQYLLAGSGLEFLAYQETGVAQHPQPVSPSGVVDINHRKKHEETFGELESSSLPKPGHQGCIGKGYPQRMFGNPQPAMDMLLGTKQVYLPQRALGGTSPEDKLTDLHSPPPLTAHQTKALPRREMEATFMIHRPNPMVHPRTESFGLEERQENEEINIAIGMGKKEPPKTTAAPTALKSVMAPSDEELLAKFKKKKEKNNSSTLKEFKPGVLLPRPTSARSPLLVTQPLQDPEAKFPEYSLVPRNDQGFETKLREAYEDCHGHLPLSRCTRRVTEQEFLTATEHLPETNQDGLWIVDHGLHPNGGAYCEDVHFTAQRVAKGGFGTVSRCRDKASEKPFIQKKMLKEKWRKAENIALMMLKEQPNICQILGMKQERDGDGITVSLFLEDAGVSLSQLVRMTCPGKLSSQQIWNIAEQMFSGLVALHRYEVLHLDLKPDNICIQVNRGNFILKIVDLGSAKLSQEPFSFFGMTPEYLSPEICTCFIAHQPGVKNLAEKLISSKADVAAGALIIMYMIEGYDVLLRFITNGQTSYTGKTEAEIKTLRTLLVVTHACNPDLASHLISEGIDMNLRELLNGCLVGEPEKRFTSEQALQFIWGMLVTVIT